MLKYRFYIFCIFPLFSVYFSCTCIYESCTCDHRICNSVYNINKGKLQTEIDVSFESVSLESCMELDAQIDESEIQSLKEDGISNKCIFPNNIEICHITQHIKSGAKNSDLIPGIYEGGGKIWECTQDLAHFLTNSMIILNGFNNKLVLDLGCGFGILGIIACKFGAITHFQDYNKEVLYKTTRLNLYLNQLEKKSTFRQYRMYSGDWLQYIQHTIDDPKFDIILTSETIYNPHNYEKILKVFKSKLSLTGVVYLAAKTYYFGVGGSLREFEKLLIRDGTFEFEVVFVSRENVQREILKITHRKTP